MRKHEAFGLILADVPKRYAKCAGLITTSKKIYAKKCETTMATNGGDTLMQIESAELHGELLLLRLGKNALPAAEKFVNGFKPCDYSITRVRQGRSRDANAKMWAVCDDIAKATGVTKEDIYRDAIRNVGVYEPLPIKEEAVDNFIYRWGHKKDKGIGWFAEVVDRSKLPGYKLVFAYYGSSTYDVKEMGRLLDFIIGNAKTIGLDVITEREKSLLLETWGKERG